MKSEKASILGKLRRQIVQLPDSPFQRHPPPRPAPRSYLDNKPLKRCQHKGPRHAPDGSAPPSFSVGYPTLRPRPFLRAVARLP